MAADSTPINIQAFQPYGGGEGRRLALNSSTSSSVAIPGLGGGCRQEDNFRVLVTNSGSVPAYVRMGGSGVGASTGGIEILPGDYYLLTPPFVGAQAVWIAGITETGTTKINACAGVGT